MSATPPLPFPTPDTLPSPESSRLAVAELSETLRNDLAWAVIEEGEPSYEELEAAVDGTLNPEATERLQLRAEADPELARELAELSQLRDRLRPVRPAPLRFFPARILRISGLAAALLLAVVGLDRGLGRSPDPAASSERSVAAQPTTQPVHIDGFESGDASGWAQ